MSEIELTQGQVALVDATDYFWLNKYKWYAQYNSCTYSYYAAKQKRKLNGKQIAQYMHRVILNAPPNKQVDHINHNTLDNRKQNLRICTRSQNQMNRTPSENTSSKYKGVHWCKQGKKWRAQIQINGKRLSLGLYKTEIEASCAYNVAAKILFGKFVKRNNNNVLNAQYLRMIKEKIQCKKNKR